jgi:NAD-dependent deacetylase
MKARSVTDPERIYELTESNCDINLGDKDPYGDQLRPHIVWFGEAVPMIDPAIDLVEQSDIFVIIGTSLNVYPAAGLLNYIRHGQPVYLIDPMEVKSFRQDINYIKAGASEGVGILSGLLKKVFL